MPDREIGSECGQYKKWSVSNAFFNALKIVEEYATMRRKALIDDKSNKFSHPLKFFFASFVLGYFEESGANFAQSKQQLRYLACQFFSASLPRLRCRTTVVEIWQKWNDVIPVSARLALLIDQICIFRNVVVLIRTSSASSIILLFWPPKERLHWWRYAFKCRLNLHTWFS